MVSVLYANSIKYFLYTFFLIIIGDKVTYIIFIHKFFFAFNETYVSFLTFKAFGVGYLTDITLYQY